MIGMGSGGIFGRGLGQSVEKIFYLPEAHTDMIFAIIGEELGLVGSFAVIAAYMVFAYAGLRIALGCRDPFGKRLAAGLTVLVCGQAGLNLPAGPGLPGRPGRALLRAGPVAAGAPAACLRILARRRPDVVLGGGGYVAGPMVLAAWLRWIPAALMEADAHFGLANRLAAPFARRV